MNKTLKAKRELLARKQLTNKLLENLTLSTEEVNKVVETFHLVELEKNRDVFKKNEPTNNVYFIVTGMIKAYYIAADKKFIDWFGIESDFFGNIYKDQKKSPGLNSYKTLEKSVLLKLNYLDLENLFEEFPNIERLTNSVIIRNYIAYVERIHDLRGYSALEKYNRFIKKFPEISLRVPLVHLANYLSIAPETLSRIRSSSNSGS